MTIKITVRGSRALVTGAGSGIGRATSVALARSGAEVVAVDLDEPSAVVTAATCRDLGVDSASYQCDVADRAAMFDLAERVLAERGDVDLLVNNAGVGMTGKFLDGEPEDWDWIRSINLDGVVHGCQAFVPPMLERRRGHVVNVASGLGYLPTAMTPAYSTTKAAVLMFSRSVRPDWASRGVGVSVICPGVIDTPIIDATRFTGAMADDRAVSAAKLGFRFGHSPDLVARAVLKAVERDRTIVPVGIEARVGWFVVRFLPQPLVAAFGRPIPTVLERVLSRFGKGSEASTRRDSQRNGIDADAAGLRSVS